MSEKLVWIKLMELQALLNETINECSGEIVAVAGVIIEAFKSGKKLLICGNGGSAADSQHFAAEFVSSFSRDIRRPGLPAIALSTDTSIMTAYSNDYGFDGVFERQVEALGQKGDVLIAITTSGNSKNCIKAIEMAKSKGLVTVALTQKNGFISKISDFSIGIPSKDTQHIQEVHIASYHIICEIVENTLQSDKVEK
jgi:D-sedoheptulose 7-phosphate isomerase